MPFDWAAEGGPRGPRGGLLRRPLSRTAFVTFVSFVAKNVFVYFV